MNGFVTTWKLAFFKAVRKCSRAVHCILPKCPGLSQMPFIWQVWTVQWRCGEPNCPNGATQGIARIAGAGIQPFWPDEYPRLSPRVPKGLRHKQDSWRPSNIKIPLFHEKLREPRSTHLPLCPARARPLKNRIWRHPEKLSIIWWQCTQPATSSLMPT